MTTDIVAFLRDRLEEDEQAARAALAPSEMHPYGDDRIPPLTAGQVPDQVRGYLGGTWGEHFARHDPARVVAEVAAKRAILERCAAVVGDGLNYDFMARDLADDMLRLLASAYADHRSYLDVWKP